MPSNRPSRSTTGPPDEPGSKGAVCSRLPLIVRPRGPRNERSVPDTYPTVTRRPMPPGFDSATTGVPRSTAFAVALACRLYRSRECRRCRQKRRLGQRRSRRQEPRLVRSVRRANVMVTVSRRMLWALVNNGPVGYDDAGSVRAAAAHSDNGRPDLRSDALNGVLNLREHAAIPFER